MHVISESPQVFKQQDIKGLLDAFGHNHGEDSLSRAVKPAQWEAMAQYMQFFTLAQGQVLIKQGAQDRSLYFVESGTLSVHFEDSHERIRLAVVGAGSVLGEGGFFSNMPRNATVQAASECRMWGLTPMRFNELSQRLPGPALALAMALGAIVCKRMHSRQRRVAVT